MGCTTCWGWACGDRRTSALHLAGLVKAKAWLVPWILRPSSRAAAPALPTLMRCGAVRCGGTSTDGRAATDTDPGRTRIGDRIGGPKGTPGARPPAARRGLHSTALPWSRRTCSSCSPAAEHVRLSRSSQPVPAATTSTTTHGARRTPVSVVRGEMLELLMPSQ